MRNYAKYNYYGWVSSLKVQSVLTNYKRETLQVFILLQKNNNFACKLFGKVKFKSASENIIKAKVRTNETHCTIVVCF